jgi:hypothetical protein
MLEYSITESENKIKNKPYLFIKNNAYGALGDDFSSLDSYTLKLHLASILGVLNGGVEQDNIFGNICYRIKVTKYTADIYCNNHFLGKEATTDIFNMLNDLTNKIELFEFQNGET